MCCGARANPSGSVDNFRRLQALRHVYREVQRLAIEKQLAVQRAPDVGRLSGNRSGVIAGAGIGQGDWRERRHHKLTASATGGCEHCRSRRPWRAPGPSWMLDQVAQYTAHAAPRMQRHAPRQVQRSAWTSMRVRHSYSLLIGPGVHLAEAVLFAGEEHQRGGQTLGLERLIAVHRLVGRHHLVLLPLQQT